MMTLIWLRVALVCYAAGLLYALVALTRTSEILSKVALHASYLGMVFHFVSLTEAVVESGPLASASVHNSESLLAFLIMVVFMLAYLVYKTTTPGIVIFPLVFLLTFVAATGQQPFVFGSVAVKHGWLVVHILMIFTGYAALFPQLRRQHSIPVARARAEIKRMRVECSRGCPLSRSLTTSAIARSCSGFLS